jgi:hypothetical protein
MGLTTWLQAYLHCLKRAKSRQQTGSNSDSKANSSSNSKQPMDKGASTSGQKQRLVSSQEIDWCMGLVGSKARLQSGCAALMKRFQACYRKLFGEPWTSED